MHAIVTFVKPFLAYIFARGTRNDFLGGSAMHSPEPVE